MSFFYQSPQSPTEKPHTSDNERDLSGVLIDEEAEED